MQEESASGDELPARRLKLKTFKELRDGNGDSFREPTDQEVSGIRKEIRRRYGEAVPALTEAILSGDFTPHFNVPFKD
jgi:hypothetical protein